MPETSTPAKLSSRHTYQCLGCSKTDRKGRLIAHILKCHVPMDQVPFSCSLCNFRCQDPVDLTNHLTYYKRHRDEAAKRGGKVDLARVLKRSEKPVDVTRFLRAATSGRGDDSGDEDGTIFEEQEEAPVLPSWLAAACPVARTSMVTPPTIAPPPAVTYQTIDPSLLSLLQPMSFQPQPVMDQVQLALAAAALPLADAENFQMPILSAFPPVSAPERPTISAPTAVQAPPAPKKARRETPLLDERAPSEDDILPGLLMAAEDTDPLLVETTRPSGSDVIVAAIVEAAAKIAGAIDSNTRAIRAQAKSLDALGEVMAKRHAAPLVGASGGSSQRRSPWRGSTRRRSRTPPRTTSSGRRSRSPAPPALKSAVKKL